MKTIKGQKKKESIGRHCLKKTALISEIILILILIPVISAYNVTVNPPLYDIRYDGGDRSLSFEICHDAGRSLSIPIITEATASSLDQLSKVKIKTPYKVDTDKCKDIDVRLSADTGYESTNVIIRVYPFNQSTIPSTDAVSNIAIVNTSVNITSLNASVNIPVETVNASQNATATETETRRPAWYKWVMVLLVIVGVIGAYLAIKEYMTPEEVPNEE